MVSNKKTQLIFRLIYLVIAMVGIVASFGAFRGVYSKHWYIYYTNISNYICFFIVLTLVFYTIRDLKNGVKEGLTDVAPLFRFCSFMLIVSTFLIYNVMLGHPFQASYWKDVQGVIMHLVCPLMFMFDYLLFSKHRTLKLSAPLFSGIMPLIYVILILVRGELVIGTGTLEYPYYFLNAHANGYLYVIIYLLVLNILFMALGYAVWAYDKLVKIPEGKLKWDFSPLPKEVDINVSSEDPNNIESVENKDNNKTE